MFFLLFNFNFVATCAEFVLRKATAPPHPVQYHEQIGIATDTIQTSGLLELTSAYLSKGPDLFGRCVYACCKECMGIQFVAERQKPPIKQLDAREATILLVICKVSESN